jgi:glycosyltransferase involved in cell wall biosynthesis
MRPTRVAIVTSIHPDFDARIWKHARVLAANGIGVDLICPWAVRTGEVIDGVTLHPFPPATSRARRIFQIPLRVIPRLRALLRDVDLVHFHDIDLLPWMAVVSLFKPVVYDVHENYAHEMLVREWVPKPLRKPLYHLVRWGQLALSLVVRNIVLVAPSQEPDFSHPHFRRAYIYNYASVALLDGVANDHRQRSETVVFIGSQHINNGSLLLLDIVEQTIKRLSHVRFRATDRFSNATFRNQFLAEIERRGLQSVLELIPNVKPHELMGVLNQATIGISPNLRVPQQIMGIHTKVFEYMAAGLPMVVSDLPHQVEVVEGSQAGILAQPESVESFVQAIERLTMDRDYAIQLGRNGQKGFREKHCYESQAGALLSFYGNVLARTDRKAA